MLGVITSSCCIVRVIRCCRVFMTCWSRFAARYTVKSLLTSSNVAWFRNLKSKEQHVSQPIPRMAERLVAISLSLSLSLSHTGLFQIICHQGLSPNLCNLRLFCSFRNGTARFCCSFSPSCQNSEASRDKLPLTPHHKHSTPGYPVNLHSQK